MWITFREKFKSAFELFDLSIRNEQGKPHVPTLYLKLQQSFKAKYLGL